MKAALLVFSIFIITCATQRPSYAGRDPIGYPSVVTTEDSLANRFGDDDTPTTTIRLPIEALGDVELVKRLMKLPIDQRPFWLINWEALAANRAKPQTFTQRENSFLNNNQG